MTTMEIKDGAAAQKYIGGLGAGTSGDPFLANNGGLSIESTDNTTVTPLTGAATFTGTGEQNGFPQVTVSCQTDNTGTLFFDFSVDGSNWTTYPVGGFTVAAGIHEYHTARKDGRYFRVRLVNDAGAQTYLRLYTCYGATGLPTSPINQSIGADQDAIVVRPISIPQLDIARGQITGQETSFIFGFNEDVGTAWEDIHPNGGDVNWLTTAGKVAVSSSNAADTAAGLGVRSVEIHGLSATGEDQEEIIIMNGTTEVESALDYIRFNIIHNETVGTYGGSHQGDITVRVASGGAKTGGVLSVMTGMEGAADSSVQYGSGESGNGYFSVPLGKVAYITGGQVVINTTGTKTADIILYEREGILTTSAPFLPRRELWSAIEAQGIIPFIFNSHKKIKPLTDLFFRSKASNAGTKIEVYVDYYLVDENAGGT